jgi:hypothetical protein
MPNNLTAWLSTVLTQKLAACPDDAARARLLAQQCGVWKYRRHMWIGSDGRSELPHPVYGPITAFDFVEIITEIDQRHRQLLEATHPERTTTC